MQLRAFANKRSSVVRLMADDVNQQRNILLLTLSARKELVILACIFSVLAFPSVPCVAG